MIPWLTAAQLSLTINQDDSHQSLTRSCSKDGSSVNVPTLVLDSGAKNAKRRPTIAISALELGTTDASLLVLLVSQTQKAFG